eukprot:UN00495
MAVNKILQNSLVLSQQLPFLRFGKDIDILNIQYQNVGNTYSPKILENFFMT